MRGKPELIAFELCDGRYAEAARVSGGDPFRARRPFAVEAAVHYLDLTVALPGAPAPEPASLALVRRVLGGLLGAPLPAAWDDVTAALRGTGRDRLTEADGGALGPAARRRPLFA